jgi:hypothetical protein
MKRYLTLLFLLTVMASLSYAQRSGGFRRLQLDDNTGSPVYLTNASGSVGINTANAVPSTCALLDLSSTTKGLLIPRMNGTQVAALCQTPGMLAYNISTNTFDYWNGAAWTTLSSNADWMLSGNTLTGVEWFGSANAFDVVFKANNVEAMRIASGGHVGIGTAPTARTLRVSETMEAGNGGFLSTFVGNNDVKVVGGNTLTSDMGGTVGSYVSINELLISASQSGALEDFVNANWLQASGNANNTTFTSAVLGRVDNAITSGTQGNIYDFYAITLNSAPATNYVAYGLNNFSNSSTITNFYGFAVNNINNSGTITNTYGMYVGDITAGTQTNKAYSFYASDPNARSYFNGTNGFGVSTAPNTTVDVGGSFAIRRNGVFNLGAGAFDLGIGTGTGFYDVTTAVGGSSARGLSDGADGRIMYLYNTGPNNLTIVNEDAGTTAADRIHTMKGANQTVTGEAMITLIYNANISRWLVVSVQD